MKTQLAEVLRNVKWGRLSLAGALALSCLGMAQCRAKEAENGQAVFGLDKMDPDTRRNFLIFAGITVLCASGLLALRTKAK